jgi:hypothetical protein
LKYEISSRIKGNVMLNFGCGWISSFSTVTTLWTGCSRNCVQLPADVKDLTLLSPEIPTGSGVYPASSSTGTGGSLLAGKERSAHRVLVGKPEEKRSHGRLGRRWKDNIKMDLREVGWGMDRTDLAQDRDRCPALVNAVMNLPVPQNAGNFLTS